MHPIQVAPGQLLRLTFTTASVEAGVGAHRVSLGYLAEPMGLPAGCVVLLGGSLVLFPGGWLGSLQAEPLPISATAAYPRPVDLTTTITDGQLLALEAARAGRDLELLVTVRYLTALGMLLTLVYMAGLLFRPRRRIARMGIDSIVVLGLYVVGVAGLFAIAAGS